MIGYEDNTRTYIEVVLPLSQETIRQNWKAVSRALQIKKAHSNSVNNNTKFDELFAWGKSTYFESENSYSVRCQPFINI